ncbi:MAG: adenylyl-sulfate kinase [Pseudomonadota bacterium]
MTEQKATNIKWHHHTITKALREQLNRHKAVVLWFTGLPSAGKSTLAQTVEKILYDRGCRTYVLDGDNVRHGLNKNLGFSLEDRKENIRRIGEVARLFADAGMISMTAFISPYVSDRALARSLNPPGEFIEVFVKCTVDVCEQRDPKGMYKKARAGEIKEFTGVSAPYEPPPTPEITVDTAAETLEESAAIVIAFLEEKGIIPKT